jgi:hypothetical protein
MCFEPIFPPPAPAAPRPRLLAEWRAPWLQDPDFLRSDERRPPYPEFDYDVEPYLFKEGPRPFVDPASLKGAKHGIRFEQTRFGVRVYYTAAAVPNVLDEAREMFWMPFMRWRATLTRNTGSSERRYSLHFVVYGREVFQGEGGHVARLLSAFEAFLDACRDQVDERGFTRRLHPPSEVARNQHSPRRGRARGGGRN